MKRTVSIGLALSLALAALSFAGGKQEPAAAKAPIVFWHYFSQATYEALSAQIKQYNALPSAKAVVGEQSIPRAELSKRYTLGVVSGDLPDLGMVDNPDSCSFAAMGVFADVTDRFAKWTDNKYQPGPLNSGAWKGKQYTLPIRSNCLALWTNDAMMKEAGVDKLPATWDELEAVCQKLQKANPKVYPLAFCAVKTEEATFQLLPFILSAGATVDTLDSPEGIKAFTVISNLVKARYASAECINWTQNDVEKQFSAGNAAMMINGCWQIPNVAKDAPGMKYTVVYLPKDRQYASGMGGENLGICKTSKNADAAWDFVTWILGTGNSAKFNAAVGTISPHANATAEMQYPNNPTMKVFIEQLAYAAPRGPHPKWPELSSAIQEAIQQSILGAKTPEAAAKDAAAKIAQINASVK